MHTIFIDVKYKGEIKLPAKALKKLQNYKTLALYTTTQFKHKIQDIEKQLKKQGIKVISSQPQRTSNKYQILGCDVYHNNLNLNKKQEKNINAFLYIGDGRFHPNALLFAEQDSKKPRDIIIFNPTSKKLEILNQKDIKKILQKKQANIARFYAADNIGILVTTKPGQSHTHYTDKLEKKYSNKNFYKFITDIIDFQEMENFPYIQCWINTACPRIALEDALNTQHALINPEDVLEK